VRAANFLTIGADIEVNIEVRIGFRMGRPIDVKPQRYHRPTGARLKSVFLKCRITSSDVQTEFFALADRAQAGRYGVVGETLRTDLRRLEEREAKLRTSQAARIAEEESGLAAAFDSEAFLEQMRDKRAR
jgi:antitoxin ParD1/3/4